MNPEEAFSSEELERIDQEFTRLRDHHYLDHAGATLYSERQIESVYEDLRQNIYSNPHTSKETEDLIDQVRFRVLQHFNTTSSEYQVVFNRGATEGLKTVAECFDFNADGESPGQFMYLRSCHTSVLGMREVVRTNRIVPVEVEDFTKPETYQSTSSGNNSNSLFVFPAQCNFNGFKYDLNVIQQLHEDEDNNMFVCLDAAAFVGSNFLDLSKYHPDFVVLSFYKLFGYPTGLGALLVSKRGEKVLKKRYYGGGTVLIAMGGQNYHRKRPAFQDHFQDGTISFLSIISLLHGFRTIERLVPPSDTLNSMQRISAYTFQLARYLFVELGKLKYSNGQSVVEFYSQSTNYESSSAQGGIVNFNVLHSDGNFVGFSELNCMAEIHDIRLRVGCFCNPGACQRALQLSDEELLVHYKAGHVCGDAVDLFDNVPTGSVRVSVGYMTRKRTVDALIEMVRKCYLNQVETIRGDDLLGETEGGGEVEVVLEQICVYPIKSCGPFRVFSKWELTTRGLKFDREWMIINSNGVAVTQKILPQLCLIRPLIDERRGVLRLTMRGESSIEVPLKGNLGVENSPTTGSMCRNSKVCGDRINGFDCGDPVAEWLDRVLEMNGLRLIRQNEEEKRFLKSNPEMELSLNNSAQFLLVNITSVKWLMSQVDEYSLEMDNREFIGGIVDRFRGNFIVSTKSPLEERNWQGIELSGTELIEAGPCTRCQMICIDQGTGEKTTEPLRTIGRVFGGRMRFGIYFKQASSVTENSSEPSGPTVALVICGPVGIRYNYFKLQCSYRDNDI